MKRITLIQNGMLSHGIKLNCIRSLQIMKQYAGTLWQPVFAIVLFYLFYGFVGGAITATTLPHLQSIGAEMIDNSAGGNGLPASAFPTIKTVLFLHLIRYLSTYILFSLFAGFVLAWAYRAKNQKAFYATYITRFSLISFLFLIPYILLDILGYYRDYQLEIVERTGSGNSVYIWSLIIIILWILLGHIFLKANSILQGTVTQSIHRGWKALFSVQSWARYFTIIGIGISLGLILTLLNITILKTTPKAQLIFGIPILLGYIIFASISFVEEGEAPCLH